MTRRLGRTLVCALAGLQTGVTGALAMLVWLALGSLLSRRSPWWMVNLVASVFYGELSIRNASGVYTIVGLALIVFFYGLLGSLFGLALRENSMGLPVFFSALLVALAVDWALLRWFWKGANPLAHLYASDGQILAAHLLFGCFLARYPRVLRKIARA